MHGRSMEKTPEIYAPHHNHPHYENTNPPIDGRRRSGEVPLDATRQRDERGVGSSRRPEDETSASILIDLTDFVLR